MPRQEGTTGIKRLETRIGRLWGFRRKEEGEVARLTPERTIGRLVNLFIASRATMSSFLKEKLGEKELKNLFRYQGHKFGEGWERQVWSANDIAKNMIRLNFQPFGIEAQYRGNKEKAKIIVHRCPLPEKFLQAIEYLREITIDQSPTKLSGMFASLDKVSSSWDWPPKKVEVCATCRIVMPTLGEVLGFVWSHHVTEDSPPKCIFEIKIPERNREPDV
ncbi:MAG: hypothetical protein JSW72_08280 [Candidatus Bathyarchaeota archaeon]|nr:MAG: hypothetical protein JSW72_08280 [Candidatus Bathyarchaeota archaeon]